MYGVKQVLTIDKSQGIDCDIVIISYTKQTADKGVLLKDLKRLAQTRSKFWNKAFKIKTDRMFDHF